MSEWFGNTKPKTTILKPVLTAPSTFVIKAAFPREPIVLKLLERLSNCYYHIIRSPRELGIAGIRYDIIVYR